MDIADDHRGVARPLFAKVVRTSWREGDTSAGQRAVPEEVAVAFTYNGGTHAVMMATPADLEDFAIGFSLTESIVRSRDEIKQLEIVDTPIGVEARMWLSEAKARALVDRRRHNAGPTGCGLCGIESLTEAVRSVPSVPDGQRFTAADIAEAVNALGPLQSLNHVTHAVHGAAFWQKGEGIVAVREDVGRHNALDKLIGALARQDIAGSSGLLVMTSRVSVELVQKAALASCPILVAVSAPTALAIRTADAAGMTLVAVARSDGFEVFTHAYRIAGSEVV